MVKADYVTIFYTGNSPIAAENWQRELILVMNDPRKNSYKLSEREQINMEPTIQKTTKLIDRVENKIRSSSLNQWLGYVLWSAPIESVLHGALRYLTLWYKSDERESAKWRTHWVSNPGHLIQTRMLYPLDHPFSLNQGQVFESQIHRRLFRFSIDKKGNCLIARNYRVIPNDSTRCASKFWPSYVSSMAGRPILMSRKQNSCQEWPTESILLSVSLVESLGDSLLTPARPLEKVTLQMDFFYLSPCSEKARMLRKTKLLPEVGIKPRPLDPPCSGIWNWQGCC